MLSEPDFGDMAIIFERVVNVIDHFDQYAHIEQIANLARRVKTIRNELCARVRKNFEDSLSNPFTKVHELDRDLDHDCL